MTPEQIKNELANFHQGSLRDIYPNEMELKNPSVENLKKLQELIKETKEGNKKNWVERNQILYGIIMAAIGAGFAVLFDLLF